MEFWQAVYLILGLHLNIRAHSNLNHNYVISSLIAFRKKNLKKKVLNALLFSLLKARMCVCPGYWIALVGPEWMGTFILGSTCTSFLLSCTLPDSCPKPVFVGWWCWSFIEHLPQQAAHWESPSERPFQISHTCRVADTFFFCSSCYWVVFVRESNIEDFKIFQLQSYQVKWIGIMGKFLSHCILSFILQCLYEPKLTR